MPKFKENPSPLKYGKKSSTFKMKSPLKKTYKFIDEDGDRRKVKTDKWGRVKKTVIKSGGGRHAGRGGSYRP